MKKSLLKEMRTRKKELFPIQFSNLYPVNINSVRKNRRYRAINTLAHQSEIYCLRIYKDGINLFTD